MSSTVMSVELFNDDCFKILEELKENSVKIDMVLTDLPYNLTQCNWDTTINIEQMWEYLIEITRPTTPILFFGNEPFSSYLRLSQQKLYKYDIIWDKIIRTGHLNAKKQPLRQYENIIVFYEKQPTYNPIMWDGKEENHPHRTKKKNTNVYGKHHEVPTKLTKKKYPTNIIRVNARSSECNNTKRVHPTQKPVELLVYLIKTYSNEGDTVLDFTMGSGSTGVACMETDRNFIGIELDKKYYDIAKQRTKEATEQKRLI